MQITDCRLRNACTHASLHVTFKVKIEKCWKKNLFKAFSSSTANSVMMEMQH